MTLPPERIGDKGQRYVVECKGYPKDGWHPIAYTNSRKDAERMAEGILKAPTAEDSRIIDREQSDEDRRAGA